LLPTISITLRVIDNNVTTVCPSVARTATTAR
jgi:hypothetical protein